VRVVLYPSTQRGWYVDLDGLAVGGPAYPLIEPVELHRNNRQVCLIEGRS
jgi:hypothetical protein